MKEFGIAVLTLVGFAIVCVGLSIAGSWFGIWHTNIFGVAQADATRKVFEQSHAFISGQVQDLRKLKLEYTTTKDSVAKKALAIEFVRKLDEVDQTQVPSELLTFAATLQN